MIASLPSRGRLPCAARPCTTISAHENPLCATPIARSVGSVITASSARHRAARRVGAQAGVLLVGNRGDDDTARAAPTPDEPTDRGVQHGGQAALHVLTAAAVQSAVAYDRIERRRHALDTDGVGVPAEKPDRPAAIAVRDTDDVRASGRNVCALNIEASALQPRGEEFPDRSLARATWHERWVDRIDRDEVAGELDDGHGLSSSRFLEFSISRFLLGFSSSSPP